MTRIKWFEELKEKHKFGISNSFVVTGNIDDYILTEHGLIDLEGFLISKFVKNPSINSVYTFDLSRGLFAEKEHSASQLFDKNENEGRISELRHMINLMEEEYKSTVLIVSYPEFLVDKEGRYLQEENQLLIDLQRTMNSLDFVKNNNLIIFVTESSKDLHHKILSNSNLSEVKIDLPNYEERLDFINFKFENDDYEGIDLEVSLEGFSNITAGLSLKAIEDILLSMAINNKLTYRMVVDKKKELIEKEHSDLIEIMETEGKGLDNFAGKDNIKKYFKEVVIDAIKDGNTEIVPKGILFSGPPGTGKTYFAQCLAGDAGINSIEFKMSKIKSKWVGESSRNLEKAFSVFKALAPVIVFIDELDQVLSRGSDSSNKVDNDLFSMFLAELSKEENRGKIIWIGASNYPNLIDEALKRTGRFDKKIPFFAPEKEELVGIVKLHLDRMGKEYDKSILSPNYKGLKKLYGYSQAEIESVVIKAYELAVRKKLDVISLDIFNQALSYMTFNTTSNREKIKEMEDIAIKECNDLEFLPKSVLEQIEETDK